MPVGTVKFFNDSKGYGFIHPDDGGNDAFVHITAVEKAGMRTLQQNQRLTYERRKTSAARPKPSTFSLPDRKSTGRPPRPVPQRCR